MRFRWWYIPAGLAGLVVIVIVVGVVLLSVQDVNESKDLLTRKVSEETGRELTIAGDFDLSISFSPSITADNVTFENAEWGSRPEMLKLGHVEAEVALFPMLGGNIEIKRLILKDLDLLAETDSGGHGNWEFGEKKPSDESHGDGDGKLPVIEDMRIENALVLYNDGQTGERHSIMIAGADARTGDGGGAEFALDGVWNNSPITAQGSIGPGDKNVPVAFLVEMFGATTKIDGTLGELEELAGSRLHISTKGEKLSDLNIIAGDFPAVGPYALEGDLTAEGDDLYIFDNFSARIAASDIAGRLELTPDEKRPHLKADLTSSKLDLDALMAKGEASPAPAAEASGGGGDASASDSVGAAKRLFPDEPLDLAALDKADAQVTLKVAELAYNGLTLRDADIALDMREGRLKIAPVTAHLGSGGVTAALELDGRAARPTLAAKLNLAKVGLADIKPLFDMSEIADGPLDLDISVAGQGRSPHEIAASLGGNVDMVIGKGIIPNEYVDLIAADLLRFIIPGGEAGDAAQLNCFVARFDIANGVALNKALLLDTALVTTAGKGQIDLGRETADLTIAPKPKDASLMSLAIPVVVDGPLTNLNYNLKKEEAFLGLAGAVLGTAVLGPFGILIPMVSAGTDDENPCIAALEQPAESAQQRPARKAAPETPTEAVEDLMDNVLGIFD
jgi:uncharacterized protein involved in outer membrane biogenesis